MSVDPAGGAAEWLAGTTIRPFRSTIACPGPVAYQRQPAFFATDVISLAGDQVRPLSVLRWTNTRRLSCSDTVPDMISFSVTRPLRVVSSTTVPSGDTTGAGLPAVASPLSDTTVIGPHVQPPSVERRCTTRIAPVSPAEETRPSANA